jgi:hypothetical protein
MTILVHTQDDDGYEIDECYLWNRECFDMCKEYLTTSFCSFDDEYMRIVPLHEKHMTIRRHKGDMNYLGTLFSHDSKNKFHNPIYSFSYRKQLIFRLKTTVHQWHTVYEWERRFISSPSFLTIVSWCDTIFCLPLPHDVIHSIFSFL